VEFKEKLIVKESLPINISEDYLTKVEIYAHAMPDQVVVPDQSDRSFGADVARYAIENKFSEPITLLPLSPRIRKQRVNERKLKESELEFRACLLEDDMPEPLDDDMSEYAQIIRYAQEAGIIEYDGLAHGYYRDLTREGIEPNPGPRDKRNKKTKQRYKRRGTVRPKLQTVQSQHKIVKLEYEEAITDYNNTGGPIVSGEYRFTDVYDIDPAIMSRSIQFCQYMFDIYQYAKVISADVEYIFDNLEAHAVEVSAFHSNQSLLSSLGSRGQIESQQSTALLITKNVMSEQWSRMSQLRIKFRLVSGVVAGNKIQFKALDTYSCTSSSSPTIPLYTSWTAFISSGVMTYGFTKRSSYSLRVYFYGPRPLSSIIRPPLTSKPSDTQKEIKERHKEEYERFLAWKQNYETK